MLVSVPRSWSRFSVWIGVPPLVFLFALLGAVGAGVIVATGEILYAALFGGALIGLFIAGSPVLLFWVAIIISLVLAGVTQLYLPELQYIRWLVALAGLGLAAHAFLALPTSYSARPTPAIFWWALAFFCITLFSTLINMPSTTQALKGLKGYFQVWGLVLALAYIPRSAALVDNLPRVLLGIALLQVPFALHQYLILVPLRASELAAGELLNRGMVPVDIVVGTFGADLEGGGVSSLLSAFQFMVVSGVIALWRRNLLSHFGLLILSVILLTPLLFNQTKVSLVYGLIVFLVLYHKDIVIRPLRFLGVSLVVAMLCAIFLQAYTVNAPSSALNKKVDNWGDLVTKTYEDNVGDEETTTGALTRWATFKFWAQQHGWNNVAHTALGHGAGVTRRVRVPGGETAMRSVFPMDTSSTAKIDGLVPALGMGNTSVAALLWETGIIGLLCVFGLFWAAYRTALDLEYRHGHDPWLSALFSAAQAGVGIFFVSLWYNNLFVFQVSYQTAVTLLFGYLVYWYRR